MSHSFPGVLALDDVSFDLCAGEVHALVGENGAGKSTLINIVSGVLRPDRGDLLLQGKRIQLTSPRRARSWGVIAVHQEAELFADLSAAENMALMQGLPCNVWGLVDWRQVYRDAQHALADVAQQVELRQPAGRLSVAHRHMTQVAAAVAQRAKILILDEPTSALSEVEAEWLFAQVARLQSSGAAIIYISHRQQEIFRLADRISVLRDGRLVWTGAKSQIDHVQLVAEMVGREIDPQPQTAPAAPRVAGQSACLRVQGLTDAGGRFANLDLVVRAGEIVGIYGLVGAGRTAFAQALFGLRKLSRGSIQVDGRPLVPRRPVDAVRAGIAYLPEDRLQQAICKHLSVRANAVLASLWRYARGLFALRAAETEASRTMLAQLAVHYRSVEQAVGELSGGNQQKVVLGRWLLTQPKVLILDEPTRGVDVGAKSEIYELLNRLAKQGCGVIMISSELPEVMQHASRVVVFREGQIAAEFDPRRATPSDVTMAALPAETRTERTANRGRRREFRPGRNSLPRSELGLSAVVAVLAVWIALTSTGFSVSLLLSNAALWVILGLAAAVVIIAGGIDISIGAVLALSAACAAGVLRSPLPTEWSMPIAVLTAAVVGTLAGLLNAAIALWGKIHPIVVTLGTMTIYRGLVIALLGGRAITGLPPAFGRWASNTQLGVSGATWAALAIALGVQVWLVHTRSGRYLFAVGSGPAAARLAGISRTRTWLLAFAVGGLLVGLAGALQLAMSEQMQSRLGLGWELNAIAVAVIGGVSITGGRGSVLGVALGALLVRLIHSGLIRWGITEAQFELFVGGMILTAVLLDLAWRRLRHD